MNTKVYKYREDNDLMVEVGELDESNILTFNPPISKEYDFSSLNISLYGNEFYIYTDKVSKTMGSCKYRVVVPNNLADIKEIQTNAADQSYVLGYLNNGKAIFYDQYLK